MLTTGTRVSTALDHAVEEMGRRLADNPDRLRAVLLDELGADAREHRAEVEAVVVAAAQRIPTELARRRRGELAPSDFELSELVRSHDTSDDLASFAVAAWSGALRLDGGSLTVSGLAPLSPRSTGSTQAVGSDVTHVVNSGPSSGSGVLPEATTGPVPISGFVSAGASVPPPSPPPTPSDLVFGGADSSSTGSSSTGSRDRPSRRGGVVLTWWMLVAFGTAIVLLAAVIGWVAGHAGDSHDTVAGASATHASTPAKTGPSASSTASAPSASATATPTPTPTPVALTASDVVEPTFTPVLVDASTKSWQPVTMPITSTGTWDKIEVVGLVEQHGTVNVGADGMVDGTTLTYQPKHNGYFVDHILLKLHNSATGEVSNQVTITVNATCDTTLTAFPCVHHGPGDVMTGM